MTFFKKKPKKRGQGCPRKETTTPPPLANKQQVEEAGKLVQKQNVVVAKKYINYSDPVVATALKKAANHYNETGRYPTHEDAILSDQPLLSPPQRYCSSCSSKSITTIRPDKWY
jgi:hypothetical protein